MPSSMDTFEVKACNVLQRLREIRAQHCCPHIDRQIDIWIEDQLGHSQKELHPKHPQPQPQPHPHSHPHTNPNPYPYPNTQQQPQQQPLKQEQQEQELKQELKQELRQEQEQEQGQELELEQGQEQEQELELELELEQEQAQQQEQQQQPEQQQQQQQHNHHNILEEPPQLIPQLITQSSHRRHLESLDDIQASDERTIGCFLANLKHLEGFDSDATESTSSNDSYDELEGFSQEEIPPRKNPPVTFRSHSSASSNNQPQHHRASTSSLPSNQNQLSITPNQRRASHLQTSDTASSSNAINAVNDNFVNMANLQKKSIWKWAKDRSRLASKWTWLQAQIADLEFRVRGQNDALIQAKTRKVPPIPPLPESSCSRTVPLSKDFRNRCLIKSTQILSDSSKSSVKFSQVPCVCSSLPQTVAPCLSCKGRYNYLKQSEGENAPLQERASQIDPGCHPVLSHPDDITLGSQISYLLKRETINRKPVKGKPGRKKGSLAASTINASSDDKASGKHVTKKGKFYQGMSGRTSNHAQGAHLKNTSSTMIASNKLKRKYRKHSNNQTNNYDSNTWFRANSNHAHDNNNNGNSTKRNKRIRSTSSMNESALYSDSSNPYRPNHFNNGSNSVRTVTRRRRSEQSAYDINNIVIPYGIAASTRVEILEYKEIMTPSWRVCDNNGVCEKRKDNNLETDIKKEEDEVEDTSDEAYILRHTKGEHEEKKRFSLKPPPKNETSQDSIPADK